MRTAAGIAVFALIAAAPVAHAEIYRWVDERGVVNYGAKPARAGARHAPLTGREGLAG